MFELKSPSKAKLAGVNVRSELHGKELVPAVDLKLQIDAGNDMLDRFDPDLKAALYYRAQEPDDEQQELDGVEPLTDLPNLRFPKLGGPLKWEIMGAGYSLILDYGLGGGSNLVLDGCEVNNFSINPKEGGAVEVAFRVQAVDLDSDLIGKLATLVQHEVTVTLTAPVLSEHDYDPPPMANPFPVDGSSEEPENPFGPEQALAAAHADSDA